MTQQVISALLTKFNITDNAMKFALYERTFDDSRHQLGKYAYLHAAASAVAITTVTVLSRVV